MTGWLLLSISLIFLVAGMWRTEIYENKFGHSNLAEKVGEKITVQGIIVREPDKRETNNRLFVKVGDDLLLVTTDRYNSVFYGDEVSVTGKLNMPDNFTTEFGRTFNYVGYLKAQGVEYQISFAQVEVLKNNLGNTIITKLLDFKLAFMNKLETTLTEPAVGLGEGLLLGVKQALGEDLEKAFRATGIIHIVVLSGYNVMLVVAFVMYVLSYFFALRSRVVVGIIAITLFALLVGLSATVVRASIMASILLIAQATGRMYLVLRALLFAGFIMLIFNPFLLVYDVGFQLSFMATLGLILIAPILERFFSKVPKLSGIQMFLVATVATQIAVLPLLLYQIGQFSVVAVVVNLLVLPMVPIAMLLTFATGMTAFVSSNLALLLSYPTYWSLTYINSLALWFADLSFSSFVVPTFSFYVVPIAYFILGIIWWKLYKPEYGFGQSEIAENFLIKDKRNFKKEKSQDKLILNSQEWVIEEENEKIINETSNTLEMKDVTKQKAGNNPASHDDVPIFFR